MNIKHLTVLTALIWNVNLHTQVCAGDTNWTSGDVQFGLHGDNLTRNDVTNDSPTGAQNENEAHSLITPKAPQLTKYPHTLWDTRQSENVGDARDNTEYKGPNNSDGKFSYRKAGAKVDQQQTNEKGSPNLKGSPANKQKEPEGLKHGLGTEQTLEDEGLKKKEQRKHEREEEGGKEKQHGHQLKSLKEEEEWKAKPPSIQEDQNEEEQNDERKEKEEKEEQGKEPNDASIQTSGQKIDKNLTGNTHETEHGVVGDNLTRDINGTVHDEEEEEEEPQRNSLYFSEGHSQHKLGERVELPSGTEGMPVDFFERWVNHSTSGKRKTGSRFPRQTILDESPFVYREACNTSSECLCSPACNTSATKTDLCFRENEENVAYNKPAKISTRYTSTKRALPGCGAVNGRVGHVFDYKGNPDANCIHSANFYPRAWWRVDLVYVYTFRKVILFARDGTEGYARMVNVDVFVDAQLCKRYPGSDNRDELKKISLVSTVACGEVLTGRYVAFAKREETSGDMMNFCEVQLWVCKKGTYGHQNGSCSLCPANCQYCDNWYGCDPALPVKHNAAIHKRITESTEQSNGFGGATDGMFLPQMVRCFRQSVNSDAQFWVRVDLEHTFKIFYYRIHSYDNINRPARLKDFYSAVSDQATLDSGVPPGDVLCHHFSGDIPDRSNHTANCSEPKFGRYFFLTRLGDRGFKLCELEVFGHRVYVLNNGAGCNDTNKMAVCLKGSFCHTGSCRITVPHPCSTVDDHCVPEAECDDDKCKYIFRSNCNETSQCVSGLKCDPVVYKCKQTLHMPCSDNTDCLINDVCDPLLSRCRRTRGANCTKSEECTAGAICQNSECTCQPHRYSEPDPNDLLCKPLPGLISADCGQGQTCTMGQCQNNTCTCTDGSSLYAQDYSCKLSADSACGDNSDCNTGMKCQNSKCKIKAGWSCYLNSDSCATGLTCEDDICKVTVGGTCNTEDRFCAERLVCSNETCKLKLNDDCSQATDQCLFWMTCSVDDNSTCKLTEGHRCSSITPNQCRSGTLCDSERSECRIILNQPCDSDAHCQTDTVCSNSTGSTEKLCSYRLGSSGCENNDECSGTSVCDSQHQCMLAQNANCANSPALCHTGSTCSNGLCHCHPNFTEIDTASTTCRIKDGVIGGACQQNAGGQAGCSDSRASCNDQNSMCQCPEQYSADPEDMACRVSASFGCSANESKCTSRASCVDGVCLLKAGQPCRGTQKGHCGFSTVCDDEGFCRLALHQNCSGQPINCKKGTTCDSMQKCKTEPANFCRKDDECMAGSQCVDLKCQCNTTVSVLRNGVCELNVGIAGAACDDAGNCYDINANCSEQSVCQCQNGLVPEARLLKCTKQAGDDCIDDSECTTGTRCDQKTGQCKIKPGGLCGGGDRDNCRTGAVCDFDSICRLDLKGNCLGELFGQCKRNTYCDKLNQCGHAAGDPCTISDTTDSCVAGAVCNGDSVCDCQRKVSIKDGVICEPLTGHYGSTCADSIERCTSPKTECEDGFCVCEGGVKPDRLFSCGYDELTSENGIAAFLGVGFGLLGVLVGLGIYFVHRYAQQKKKREEVLKEGDEELKKLHQLEVEVVDVVLVEVPPDTAGAYAKQATSEPTDPTTRASDMSTSTSVNELNASSSEMGSSTASGMGTTSASEFGEVDPLSSSESAAGVLGGFR